jgi:Tfp pilus assembly protein PilF
MKKEKRHPRLWQNIINMYFKFNMNDSARYYAEQMLQHDSITDIPYSSIGYYYFLKKDTSTAVMYWEQAFRRNPTNYQRALSLAQYFASKKDSIKAQYYFQYAKSLAPAQGR